jgi:nitrite reductase (NADH) small subunit
MTQLTVCRVDEVPADRALCKRLPGGQNVAVARTSEGFSVFENRCPHAEGPIGQGRVKGNSIVCPWHFFPFDLVSGKPVGADKSIMELRRFPVSVNAGDICIDL